MALVSVSCLPLRSLAIACGTLFLFSACHLQAADVTENDYSLRVRPSICVSYNSEEPCRMDLHARWDGPARGELCLRELLRDPLLRDPLLQCWQNTDGGSVDLEFANTADVLYQLQDSATQGVLAESPVTVINRDLRNSRKRRRHVWSIL